MNFKGDLLDIDYIDRGSGKVIVLLQGWGTTAAVYESLIGMLDGNFRVIAPNFPGFGKSTEPSFAYSAEDYADFVVSFLEKLEIREASFIGHSHGGRVIIALASRDSLPFSIDRIVRRDSAGIVSKKSLAKRTRIRFYKFCKKAVQLGPVKKLFPQALDKLQKKFGSADYASSSPLMRQSMVKLVNTDYTPALCRINRPTLLIWGEKDDATPLTHAHIMQSKIPDSGLVTIKDAGHFSFVSDLALTRRVLKSFFEF